MNPCIGFLRPVKYQCSSCGYVTIRPVLKCSKCGGDLHPKKRRKAKLENSLVDTQTEGLSQEALRTLH